MKRFADLLELLALTPSRTRKIAALAQYFAEVPDPDRGLALAALTGEMDIRNGSGRDHCPHLAASWRGGLAAAERRRRHPQPDW
jgi:hypothetical protein